MWRLFRARKQTAQERQDREAAVAAEGDDDPQQALARARAAKTLARGHLSTVRQVTGELHRERVVNHLAADVYEAMRRKP